MGACSAEWLERLSTSFDGEAEPREQAAVDAHVASCPDCTRALTGFATVRASMRAGATERDVPLQLRDRVMALAGAERRPTRRRRLLTGMAAVAAVLLVFLGSWPGGMNSALAFELERHHLKAFSRLAPCEFESSDPAQVEAWIRREVGYAVEIPEIPGATLLGARRCRLHGELTASVLYRFGDRAVTIFLAPRDSKAGRQAARFAGDGARCVQGPVGEQICVAPGEQGAPIALAVSELGASALLEVLEGPGR